MEPIEIVWKVAIYLSFVGFIFLILAVLTGLRVIKTRPKRHMLKKFALTAFSLVVTHGLIMIYFYFFT
jgi:DMSO/TMAO reductase YedYZ heme-binding membrane subunit